MGMAGPARTSTRGGRGEVWRRQRVRQELGFLFPFLMAFIFKWHARARVYVYTWDVISEREETRKSLAAAVQHGYACTRGPPQEGAGPQLGAGLVWAARCAACGRPHRLAVPNGSNQCPGWPSHLHILPASRLQQLRAQQAQVVKQDALLGRPHLHARNLYVGCSGAGGRGC